MARANNWPLVTPVDDNGDQIGSTTSPTVVRRERVASGSLSSLASSASTGQLLAANANRKGLIVVNTDANDLYLKFGTTAALTDFSILVPGGGGVWIMDSPIYTGRIDAIWAAAGTGKAYVTEL